MSASLPTSTLGRTGLEVTRLGYGAMELMGAPRGPAVTDDQVKTVLNAVLDAGVNFIDTARGYGRSEELIGKYISHRRSDYFLATKCGGTPEGGRRRIWTKENLMRCLHESLKRLKTDYVDVMQLHGFSQGPSVEETQQGNLVEALREMRQQGKVRWIGFSTGLPLLPTFHQWGVFDEFQIPYSALNREHEGWITKSAEAGIGTVIRGGVAQGEPGEGRGQDETWNKFDEAKLDELRDEGERRSAFILRFTLAHPDVHTIIAGTKNPAHLRENIEAVLRGPLPAETYAEAKRRLDEVGMRPAEVPELG